MSADQENDVTDVPLEIINRNNALPETRLVELGDDHVPASRAKANRHQRAPAATNDNIKRPSFALYEEPREIAGKRYRPGVWWHWSKKNKSGDFVGIDDFVCSPLHVDAVTCDVEGNNFGRLLRMVTTLGHWRTWPMPMDLLSGSGEELRAKLLNMGVEIDYGNRALLMRYLQETVPEKQIRCSLQTGWVDDSFVLPDKTYGPQADLLVFQSGQLTQEEFGTAGTLEGWREHVAMPAIGNPMLMLGISAAFAGPLLRKVCQKEGGGIHFVGDSSTGKTTILQAACSVWGGESYARSWRTTSNGIEGAASLFNDCLLALDEISECDPSDVSAIVYALGNGTGKQRADRTGRARTVTRWRVFILSTGERSIETSMADGGLRAKAGQAVRLVNIPCARKHGVFDELHGHLTGTSLSDSIKRATAKHYGHAGRKFLSALAMSPTDFAAKLAEVRADPRLNPPGMEGQEQRVAARLALVALAGQLATRCKLTGWDEDAPIQAAALALEIWRNDRPKGNDEPNAILQQLQDFIDKHGDSRFSPANSDGDGYPVVRDRAGWFLGAGGHRTYLFTAGGLREALSGFDYRRALDVLASERILVVQGKDKARTRSIGGTKSRLYEICPNRLGDRDSNTEHE